MVPVKGKSIPALENKLRENLPCFNIGYAFFFLEGSICEYLKTKEDSSLKTKTA